jgi:hypothetical protein
MPSNCDGARDWSVLRLIQYLFDQRSLCSFLCPVSYQAFSVSPDLTSEVNCFFFLLRKCLEDRFAKCNGDANITDNLHQQERQQCSGDKKRGSSQLGWPRRRAVRLVNVQPTSNLLLPFSVCVHEEVVLNEVLNMMSRARIVSGHSSGRMSACHQHRMI